jgi:hypothetical protein
MAMQYDVKATAIAAGQTNSPVFAGPARIKGLVVSIPAAGGTISLKDGSGGTTKFSMVVPSGDATVTNILVPGEGINCPNGIYATTPADMPITVFYG